VLFLYFLFSYIIFFAVALTRYSFQFDRDRDLIIRMITFVGASRQT